MIAPWQKRTARAGCFVTSGSCGAAGSRGGRARKYPDRYAATHTGHAENSSVYYAICRAETGLMAKSPDTMSLGFEETQTPYTSGSQSARAWTETWVRGWMYCPNCGSSTISPFPNNSPVADFFCASCKEEYELKSQKSPFGNKVLDGSFRTKCDRLAADNNPNLFLLNYSRKELSVYNLFVVPKHFFVREIIEERKPLGRNSSASWLDWL